MRETTINIVVAGVGGQGILLTSNILAQVAFEHGYEVKKSEVHGMAQRGGSVVSEVRFGRKVYSPLIKKGEADFLLGMEKLETLRFIPYLKPEGLIIVNNLEIPPLGVTLGEEKYPDNIYTLLKKRTSRIIKVNALQIASKVGNLKTMNVVLLGVLSCFLPFSPSAWKKVIERRVPAKSLDDNLKAFEQGRACGEKYREVILTSPNK